MISCITKKNIKEKILLTLGWGVFLTSMIFFFSVSQAQHTTVISIHEPFTATAESYEAAEYFWRFSQGEEKEKTGQSITHVFTEPGQQWIELRVMISGRESPPKRRYYLVENTEKPTAYAEVSLMGEEGKIFREKKITIGKTESLKFEAITGDTSFTIFDWMIGGQLFPNQNSMIFAPEHTGGYSITLVAKNRENIKLKDRATWNITVKNNAPIITEISFVPMEKVGWYKVQVAGEDRDGTEDIASFKFDILSQNLVVSSQTTDKPEADFFLQKFADHTSLIARARVTDKSGSFDVKTSDNTVNLDGYAGPKVNPTARAGGKIFNTTSIKIPRGTGINFTSGAPNDPPVKHEWFLDEVPVSKEEMTTQYFTRLGNFSIRLRVSDAKNPQLFDEALWNVSVEEDAVLNTKPVIENLKIFPESLEGTPSTVFEFSAETSDPEGDSLKYEWNFGAGQKSALPALFYRYKTPGSYPVTLTVSDGLVTSDPVTKNLTIVADDDSNNKKPVIKHLEISPTSGPLDTVFKMSAKAEDGDGDYLEYVWDFGDGAIHQLSEAMHRYSSAGTYNVNISVSDAHSTVTKTKEITIFEDTPLDTKEILDNISHSFESGKEMSQEILKDFPQHSEATEKLIKESMEQGQKDREKFEEFLKEKIGKIKETLLDSSLTETEKKELKTSLEASENLLKQSEGGALDWGKYIEIFSNKNIHEGIDKSISSSLDAVSDFASRLGEKAFSAKKNISIGNKRELELRARNEALYGQKILQENATKSWEVIIALAEKVVIEDYEISGWKWPAFWKNFFNYHHWRIKIIQQIQEAPSMLTKKILEEKLYANLHHRMRDVEWWEADREIWKKNKEKIPFFTIPTNANISEMFDQSYFFWEKGEMLSDNLKKIIGLPDFWDTSLRKRNRIIQDWKAELEEQWSTEVGNNELETSLIRLQLMVLEKELERNGAIFDTEKNRTQAKKKLLTDLRNISDNSQWKSLWNAVEKKVLQEENRFFRDELYQKEPPFFAALQNKKEEAEISKYLWRRNKAIFHRLQKIREREVFLEDPENFLTEKRKGQEAKILSEESNRLSAKVVLSHQADYERAKILAQKKFWEEKFYAGKDTEEKKVLAKKLQTIVQALEFIDRFREKHQPINESLYQHYLRKQMIFSLGKKLYDIDDAVHLHGDVKTDFYLFATFQTIGTNPLLLEWDLGNGEKNIGEKVKVRYNTPGLYRVHLQVTDGEKIFSDHINIEVAPKTITQ